MYMFRELSASNDHILLLERLDKEDNSLDKYFEP